MWFKVDDHLHDHPKVRRVVGLGNLAALGLWVLSGSWCGDNGTDGFVPESVLPRWTLSKRIASKLAGILVAAGLWEPCEVDGEAGWRFHDWADVQPTRDQAKLPVDRIRWRRAKALQRNRELCEAIVARDRCQCRYCGVRVSFADKRSGRGGTYDHVDPDGENTLENVVVACRRCNGRKGDRTPAEAGMTLRPVPGPDSAGAESEPDSGSVASEPDPSRDARGGTGQIPVGSESSRGQIGPDQIGSASGPSNGNGAH